MTRRKKIDWRALRRQQRENNEQLQRLKAQLAARGMSLSDAFRALRRTAKKRPGTRDWKPCQELTPADLQRHPVWGFDLDKAESGPETDETWVRPWKLGRVPVNSDTLFVAANIRGRGGTTIPGCMCLRFERRVVVLQGLVFLSPRYVATTLGRAEGRLSAQDRRWLRKEADGVFRLLPLEYFLDIPIGADVLRLEGFVR